MTSPDASPRLRPSGTALASPDYRRLAPHPGEIAALAATSGLEMLLSAAGGYQIVNLSTPVLLFAILAFGNWRLARHNAAAIWTPLFSMRVSAMAFGCIGGLLPYIVRDQTLDYLLTLYPFSPAEASKVNLIWLVGMTMVLTGAVLTDNVAPHAAEPRMPPAGQAERTFTIGIIFVAVGLTNVLVLDFSRLLGLFSFVVPESLRLLLDALNSVGIFLISLWAFSRGGARYWAVVAIVLLNILIGLIALNKTMALFPVLFVGIGALVQRFSIVRAAAVALALLGGMVVLQPMIANARILQAVKYGSTEGGTIAERISFYTDYLHGERDVSTRTGSDEALVRFSYMNVSAYVVSQYDQNMPDQSIRNVGVALVPRFIWPDKPTLTQSSVDLYYALTGQIGSALAGSVFPDLYWNLGWPGVFFISLLIGASAFILSKWSFAIVHSRTWIMMPFVLMAFRIGISLDGGFVVSIFLPSVITFLSYPMLRAASSLLEVSGPAPMRRAGVTA